MSVECRTFALYKNDNEPYGRDNKRVASVRNQVFLECANFGISFLQHGATHNGIMADTSSACCPPFLLAFSLAAEADESLSSPRVDKPPQVL